jgi:hypothetical protein
VDGVSGSVTGAISVIGTLDAALAGIVFVKNSGKSS